MFLFNVFFALAMIFLIPFTIVDLVFAWKIDIHQCFDSPWPDQLINREEAFQNPEAARIKYYEVGSFTLRQWMFNDGFIKLSMAVIAVFLYLLRLEAFEHRRFLLSAFGIIFQMYWLFELGWLIAAAVKFWNRTQISSCDSQVIGWMWPRLIIGFIMVGIGLVVYSFRSRDRDYFNMPQEGVLVPETDRHAKIRETNQ